VFVSRRGTPLYGWQALKMLYAAEDRLGLPRASIHELRDTVASLALAAGLRLEDVRDLLGHSSIRITSDLSSMWSPNGNGRSLAGWRTR